MLTPFDKKLLDLLQTGLPIASRPFAALAASLGTEEDVVLHRLRALKGEGYLRRVGPFFDSQRMGYGGVLIALQVAPQEMERVATFVNRYPGVTHNYEREGKYNLWFTLLSPNDAAREAVLQEVRALPGVESMMTLVAKKKYKVNVQFRLSEEGKAHECRRQA